MAHPGIDTVESEACGDIVVAFDRAGLAQQPQQPILFAAGAGHLVHDPAWRADHVILHGLTHDRQLCGTDRDPGTRRDRRPNGDFERRRRGKPASFWDCGIDEDAESRSCSAAREQGLYDARHVARPPIGFVVAKPSRQIKGRGERKLTAEEIPPLRTPSRNVAVWRLLVRGLYQRDRRAGERQLEDARATVVRDPAHDVESPRRPGYVYRKIGREECPEPGIRLAWQGPEAIQGRLKPSEIGRSGDVTEATQRDHGPKPRRRSAPCSTGSIARRSASFA